MVEKYFDGIVPKAVEGATPHDGELERLATETVDRVEGAMEELQFSVALTAIWDLIRGTNKYIEQTKPWELAKDPAKKEILGSVLHHVLESLRIVSVLLQPFLTRTPGRMWEQLGITEGELTAWESARRFGSFPSGVRIKKGNPLFPRLDVKEEVQAILRLMGAVLADPADSGDTAQKTASSPAGKEEKNGSGDVPGIISIDDFAKVDLRVAEVAEAARVEGADRLLKLKLDLGGERRQVVAGIAQYYKPEELVGQKVICVANLKPAKLRGERSEGMVLAAKAGERLVLATVTGDIPNGTRVK